MANIEQMAAQALRDSDGDGDDDDDEFDENDLLVCINAMSILLASPHLPLCLIFLNLRMAP